MNKNNKTEIKMIGGEMPAPLIDGHRIIINDDGTEADIMFFQVIPSTAKEGEVSGAPVAHLRLNMEQLDAFIDNATSAKNNHTKKLKQ